MVFLFFIKLSKEKESGEAKVHCHCFVAFVGGHPRARGIVHEPEALAAFYQKVHPHTTGRSRLSR